MSSWVVGATIGARIGFIPPCPPPFHATNRPVVERIGATWNESGAPWNESAVHGTNRPNLRRPRCDEPGPERILSGPRGGCSVGMAVAVCSGCHAHGFSKGVDRLQRLHALRKASGRATPG